MMTNNHYAYFAVLAVLIGASITIISISVINNADAAGWSLTSAEFVQSFSVSPQDLFPSGIFFKPDGQKMYVIGQEETIFEYSLGTAWDISTASLATSKDLKVELNSALGGIYFRSDGKKLYITERGDNKITEFDLFIPWDISTITELRSFSGQRGPLDVFIKPDGLQLFELYSTDASGGLFIIQYTLSEAWNISTATEGDKFTVDSTTVIFRGGLFFKPDGSKMFVVESHNDKIHEYDLSTPWDITTASLNQSFSVAGQEVTPNGLAFHVDGIKFYITGASGEDINEHDT